MLLFSVRIKFSIFRTPYSLVQSDYRLPILEPEQVCLCVFLFNVEGLAIT